MIIAIKLFYYCEKEKTVEYVRLISNLYDIAIDQSEAAIGKIKIHSI